MPVEFLDEQSQVPQETASPVEFIDETPQEDQQRKLTSQETVDAFANRIFNSATLNFGDEILGSISKVVGTATTDLTGKDLETFYKKIDERIKQDTELRELLAKENWALALSADIAGGLALPLGRVFNVVKNAKFIPAALKGVVGSATEGAVIGGIMGAGEEGNRVKGAITGTATGGALGGIASTGLELGTKIVPKLAVGTFKGLKNLITGSGESVPKIISDKIGNDLDQTLINLQKNPNEMLLEQKENMIGLAKDVGRLLPKAAKSMRESLEERASGESSRIEENLNLLTPVHASNFDDLISLEKNIAGEVYKKAENVEPLYSDSLQDIIENKLGRSPTGKSILNDIRDVSSLEGRPFGVEISDIRLNPSKKIEAKFTPEILPEQKTMEVNLNPTRFEESVIPSRPNLRLEESKTIPPSFEQIKSIGYSMQDLNDLTKKLADEYVGLKYSLKPDNKKAEVVLNLRQSLLSEIDRLNPAFKEARQLAGDYLAKREGFEVGANIFNKPPREASILFNELKSDTAKQAALVGYKNRVIEQINNISEGKLNASLADKVIGSKNQKDTLKILFGKDEAGYSQFVDSLKSEIRANQSFKQIYSKLFSSVEESGFYSLSSFPITKYEALHRAAGGTFNAIKNRIAGITEKNAPLLADVLTDRQTAIDLLLKIKNTRDLPAYQVSKIVDYVNGKIPFLSNINKLRQSSSPEGEEATANQ
jgi:hypothetical protein